MRIFEEYLRLPHGMVDRDSIWEKRTREILSQHANIGVKMGFDLKRYAPLGFSSTFKKGTETTKDRVYEFVSKSGNFLMISPDSTASVMREYISSGEREVKRIAFVTPVVRQRNKNRNYRHYTQVGYAIINETSIDTRTETGMNLPLIQLAKGMKELYDAAGVKMIIRLNNYEALRRIFLLYVSESELAALFYKLQFASVDERSRLFKNIITDKQRCEQLVNMFQQDSIKIEPNVDNILNFPEEYLGIYKVARALKYYTDVDVYFEPANLQSIATVDNYHMRFVTLDGVHLGDGGEYTNYARRFHPEINSLYSVATALEEVERNGSIELPLDTMKKVTIFNMNANPMFVLQVMKEFEGLGFAVVVKGVVNKLGKAIKKLEEDCTHISILRQNDANIEDVEVEDLKSGESVSLMSLHF